VADLGSGFEMRGNNMVTVEVLNPVGKLLGHFELARVPIAGDFIILPDGEYKVSRVVLWHTGCTTVYVSSLG
jgi:hypothetical protein